MCITICLCRLWLIVLEWWAGFSLCNLMNVHICPLFLWFLISFLIYDVFDWPVSNSFSMLCVKIYSNGWPDAPVFFTHVDEVNPDDYLVRHAAVKFWLDPYACLIAYVHVIKSCDTPPELLVGECHCSIFKQCTHQHGSLESPSLILKSLIFSFPLSRICVVSWSQVNLTDCDHLSAWVS